MSGLAFVAAGSSAARAEDRDWPDYGGIADNAESVWIDTAAILGGATALGIVSFDAGSSDFHFNSEGFFGRDTGSLGMDKLGHAFTSYVIADYLTTRIGAEKPDAEFTASLLALGAMTDVEILDGFSGDHGFSYEDMIANASGIGFAWLRNEVPGLRGKVDFRMEYLPSGNISGFHPITDYSGQKYLLALKLSGFEAFEDMPLRFVELQAGYFARGFTGEEREHGDSLRREPFVGIGLNLSELLLSGEEVRKSRAGKVARRVLEYVQIPYTALRSKQK